MLFRIAGYFIGGRIISHLEQAFAVKQFYDLQILTSLNRISEWLI
jgi:hypothetical protein